MSLKQSILEPAALEWFHLRPVLRDCGGQVAVQSRVARTLTLALCLRPSPLRSGSQGETEKREAIRRLNKGLNTNMSESKLEIVT
jgi:hypothetical protein